MANAEESNESLGDLEELLGCVADLETEDVVYLEEYLATGDGWGGGVGVGGEDSPCGSISSSSLNPPSPLQQQYLPPPSSCSDSSFWSTWEDKDVVVGGKGKTGEMGGTLSSHPLPQVKLKDDLENGDGPVRLKELDSHEEAAAGVSRNGSGNIQTKSIPVRSNRGVSQPKFVSYEAFPPTKNRRLVCEVCGVRLSSREARHRHILARHVKERTNTCDMCGKSFIFKFALKTHKGVHASSPSHVCVCGASFKLRASYMDHIHRIHQAATTTKHVCKLCFKTFHDRHTLRIHLISVHMPKTISCLHPGCPKVFSTIGLMRSHYKYHLNQRFECDYCSQSFSSELYMYKHRLTHLGIRPHACVDCGRTYLSVSHLNKHRQAAHSNARPYQCSVCGKCYKSRDHLTFHENNHRGEKPYKCEVCGYMTAYRNTYYAHKKKQHSSPNANSGAKSGDSTNVDGKGKKAALTKTKGKARTRRKKNVSNDSSPVIVVTSSEKSATVPCAKDVPRQSGSQSDLPQVLMYGAEEIATSQDRTTAMLDSGKTNPKDGSGMDITGDAVRPAEGAVSVNLLCVLTSEPGNSILEKSVSESLACTPTHINKTQHLAGFVSPPAVHQIVSLENGKLEATSGSNQNEKLQLFHLLADSDLTDESGRTLEKHDSLILLSSVGKCAVPNCDTNDDSLLLLKTDANSYVGLCSQQAIIDSQENDSLGTCKLLETEELGSHIQPNSGPEEKLCEISVIAERNPSELLMDYPQQDLNSRDQHPLVTLTVRYQETGGEGETLLQNHSHHHHQQQQQQQHSPSGSLTLKYQEPNDQESSLFTPYASLAGKDKKAGIVSGDVDGGVVGGDSGDSHLQSPPFNTGGKGEFDKSSSGGDGNSSLLQSPQVTLPNANLPVTTSSLSLSSHAEKIGSSGNDGNNSRIGNESCSTGNFRSSSFVDGDSLLQPHGMIQVNLPVSSSSLTPCQHKEACLDETFSTMMELDSGMATLSGHIVDDSFSLAQLEVQCPICDQFLCMDEYVTHLECSHN